MATNRAFPPSSSLPGTTVPTDPASGGLSGAPCLVGQLPGVLLTNQRADNSASIAVAGTYNVSVKGTTGSNSAVAVGDIIYYVVGATPVLSKTSSGVRFGIALGTVTSGATATIPVRLG